MSFRLHLRIWLVLIVMAPLRSARAQPERLAVRLSLEQDKVHARLSVTDAFTKPFRKRLSGGLTSRAVLAVSLLDPKGRTIALRQRRCELRFDVWDDQIYVRIQEGTRLLRRIYVVIDDALKACGIVDIPLVSIDRLTDIKGYKVVVRVALNPISAELLERSRQFTSNPRGSASGRSQAFFGAVARLFRSEFDAGGTVFVYQSDELARPAGEVTAP